MVIRTMKERLMVLKVGGVDRVATKSSATRVVTATKSITRALISSLMLVEDIWIH